MVPALKGDEGGRTLGREGGRRCSIILHFLHKGVDESNNLEAPSLPPSLFLYVLKVLLENEVARISRVPSYPATPAGSLPFSDG